MVVPGRIRGRFADEEPGMTTLSAFTIAGIASPAFPLVTVTAGARPEPVRYPRDVVATLEDRLIIGDDSVLRDIFDEYGPLVLGISRRLVGNEAEDLVQQVFIAAWKSRSRFDPSKGSLAAWLSGIARFKAIDHLRASGRRPSTPSAEVGEMESVEPVVDRVIDRMVLTRALDCLPAARREVVELGFFDELTHAEISERLDLPLGTVKSHMRRGLEALQRELEDSRVHS
jgi:RNA polymerase sigma-70 factor (ECF subfamily)